MKYCFTCNKEIKETKIFCNTECYLKRKGYNKHSEETKKKIAKGNSKPFTEERKKNISKARTSVIPNSLIKKLDELWSLKYLNSFVIKELAGLSRRSRIYDNLYKKHCRHEQLLFMPKDWYPEHYLKLIELANQKIWYKEIAKILGFGEKQILNISKKLGLPINTRNPNAWSCVISKPELLVISWIRDANYEIDTQYQLHKFLYDAHVKNTNILIEVNGDYWHCNPKVYVNGPINDLQKSHMRRDFAKKGFAIKAGYYLITLWEKNIKENPEKTRDWLLGKIKQNLVLKYE